MGAFSAAGAVRRDATDWATIKCVEAGLVPEGVLALYPRDPVARARRILVVCGALFAAALVVELVTRLGAPIVFGLAMALAFVAVRITPTITDDEDVRRRPAVVVTATAILKRESTGFQTWMFAELVCAQLLVAAERMDLVLVTSDGTRTLIACGALESGRQLVDAVAQHLPIVML
jgi:hypothetical protein